MKMLDLNIRYEGDRAIIEGDPKAVWLIIDSARVDANAHGQAAGASSEYKRFWGRVADDLRAITDQLPASYRFSDFDKRMMPIEADGGYTERMTEEFSAAQGLTLIEEPEIHPPANNDLDDLLG